MEEYIMNLGSNIHNAFVVVYQTLKSIEKLMIKCRVELDKSQYYIPAERFLRYSSDVSWEGWIYWSYILLFQRNEDGEVMDNKWINGPVYAVEINVDSDTCNEPQLIIAKMDFGDISAWTPGCSPANHTIFYNAIHGVSSYNLYYSGNNILIEPIDDYKKKVEKSFWGFQNLIRSDTNLVEVTQDNYKEKIFGKIEELSHLDYLKEKQLVKNDKNDRR